MSKELSKKTQKDTKKHRNIQIHRKNYKYRKQKTKKMKTPSFIEDHSSQLPAIQLLINMGYEYITPAKALEYRNHKKTQVLFEDILRTQLQKINTIHRKGKEYKFSDSSINAAIIAIKDLPIQDGFINANQHLYELLTLGRSFLENIEGDKKSNDIKYIDWQTPENNVFHITEEFSVTRTARTDSYRPDIILFINGIPTVVIECKSPALKGTKTPVELGIEQNIRNFSKTGIRSLYVYSNLLLSIATNDARYATTGTSKEFWSKWKEQFTNKAKETKYNNELYKLKNTALSENTKLDLYSERFKYVKTYFDNIEKEERIVCKQDEVLYSLCRKDRLLDLIRNFTVYDEGIKKIARYQQYFTVNEIMERVQHFDTNGKRKGGVIWHTQGSGKSLTMVMLAQLLASHPKISNPKIVLVTDRISLDEQIVGTFKKCKKKVVQATSGKKLAALLIDSDDAIITTVINKFEAVVKHNKEAFLSPDIFVLIDEGHRTQYGSFNVNMRRVFKNACFLAFTGTPLMKKEKSTANKFGGYIGVPYTVLDAVKDGAVVPLLYEGRHNKITLDSKPLNKFFDKVSEPLSHYGKVQLKKKFNTVPMLNKAPKIIYDRAWDISEHYSEFFQTNGDIYKPKAQIVAPNIKTALMYYTLLEQIGKVSSAVVVSRSDQREGVEDAYYNTNQDKKIEDEYFEAMIDKYGDIKKYEKAVISQFKKQEHPEIIIVVAKLLTGFDAPRNTILYLCRALKEHTLLQAIARVNRVFPGKDYGYIIDYYGNLENLDNALSTYSGLEDFDDNELSGTLTHVDAEIAKLPQAHSAVWDIFKTIKTKNVEITAYEEFLKPEDIRNKFYEKLSIFTRLLKLALSTVSFAENTDDKKKDSYKKDAKFFLKLRVDVKRRFNDEISYKEYEPQIQKLINDHISSDGEIMKITDMVNIFDKEKRDEEIEKLSSNAARADHISSRTIKAINVKMQEDPVYYKKLSELIKETIEEYHLKRISEAEYLTKAKAFENKFLNGRSDGAPEELANNEVALSFYNFCQESFTQEKTTETKFHIEMSLEIDNIIQKHIVVNDIKVIEWSNNEDIVGKINIEIGDVIYELHKKYDIEVDWDTVDELVISCIKVAKIKYQ